MRLLVFIPLILLSTLLQAQEVKEIETDTDWTGRHCRGTSGMCDSKPQINGNTALRLSNNELTFKVYRDKITLIEETTILGKELREEGKDIFIMEEPFILTKLLRDALGVSKEAIIPAGQYPVVITKEIVEISFRIEMK